MAIRISSLNLCLGLKNKKCIIKNLLLEQRIDILCMQEIDLDNSVKLRDLDTSKFNLEVENNSSKTRVGCYVNKEIKYLRRNDLEGVDSNLVIIDIVGINQTRIINVYRSFNPQNNVSQRDKFKYQLSLMKTAVNNKTIIMGDLNLDYSQKDNADYRFSYMFDDFEVALGEFNLIQIIEFPTWSRIVNGVLRESTLDHVYLTVPSVCSSVESLKPCFGDHVLITITINAARNLPEITQRRDWRRYSKDNLVELLSNINWYEDINTVQEMWNDMELKIIKVVDIIAPLTKFVNNMIPPQIPPEIKRKINKRQKLMKLRKRNSSHDLKRRINCLNVEIKHFYLAKKKAIVRKGILPGNNKSLWTAVNIAKDIGTPDIPNNMFLKGVAVSGDKIADSFAEFFDEKVKNLVEKTRVDPGVHNGTQKLESGDFDFMTRDNVYKCIKQLKTKNSEGYDRIPQRILLDGIDILISPFAKLFTMIYQERAIPEQWLIAKITPIHKKGSKNQIENYRPVAGLCSASKIFERLILNRITDLEFLNEVNIAGKQQHGFVKNKSTATAGLKLQSIIARALDNNKYVLMASLDLSAAFDIVNVPLLVRRLGVVGLPNDVIELIEIWLKKRYFYVSVNGSESYIKETWFGIIQGSILGPILYAIFIAPLFTVENLTCYADDNYALVEDSDRSVLARKMKTKLEKIITWLSKSGMVVNESKTELCIFHGKDCHPVIVEIGGKFIISKKEINVLGVTFDSKMQWSPQVAIASSKALKALTAIRLIKRYFNRTELLQLITSNVYSLLYYNSEIWHLPNLKNTLKQKLLSVSAKAIKSCMYYPDPMISFVNVHSMNRRALPKSIMLYKLAIQMFKVYNSNEYSWEWTMLNFNQILTSRQTMFTIISSNKRKVGINSLTNRLSAISGKIPLGWLNSSIESFKVKCKKLLL